MVGDLDVRRLGCVLHARVHILDSPAQVGPLRQSAVVDVINTIGVSAGRLALLGVASRRQIRCFRSSAGFLRRVRFPAAPQQKALGVGVLCAAGGLRRLLAALGRVGGDPLEQCVECGLLLGVKGRKHALFCAASAFCTSASRRVPAGVRLTVWRRRSSGERRRSIRSAVSRSLSRPTRLVRSTRSASARSDWLCSPTRSRSVSAMTLVSRFAPWARDRGDAHHAA
jgi:hypothetical protein